MTFKILYKIKLTKGLFCELFSLTMNSVRYCKIIVIYCSLVYVCTPENLCINSL